MPTRARWRAAVALAVPLSAAPALLVPRAASADVVTLTNGREIRGKVVERRPTEIVVEVPYGRITIAHSRIRSVREEGDYERFLQEGNALAAAGQFEKALERYRLALPQAADGESAARVRRRMVLALGNLARKRLAAGEVTGAERALEDLLRLAPGDEEARKGLERIRRRRSQVGEIVERGDLLFDIGAYSGSALEYRRALALVPERADELLPRLVRAHLEQGNAYFAAHRYPDAAVHFLRALRLRGRGVEPGASPTGATTRGASAGGDYSLYEVRKRWAYAMLVPLIERINSGKMRTVGEWRLAEAQAERVAREAPEVPHVYFILGLCREALGDPAGALAAYARVTGGPVPASATEGAARVARSRANRALRNDPVRVVVALKDRRWLAVAPGGWQTITTEHFVVYHRNAFVARKVARAAEYWYKALLVHWTAPGTSPSWTRKCSIYLYPDAKTFHEAAGQPGWIPAVSHVLARDGRLRDHRISTWQGARLLNESILPHELTHIILPQLLGYPGEIPRWIHECAALLEEPDYKRYRFRRAMRAYLEAGVAMDLKDLMAVRGHPAEEDSRRFYAQCHAIAEFLMARGGRRRFLEFARRAVKEGGEKALLETYGFADLGEFDRAWRRYARAGAR